MIGCDDSWIFYSPGIANDSLMDDAGGDPVGNHNGDKTQDLLVGEFHGNDYLDGGGDNDVMAGNGKDDCLYGGTDIDQMWGDETHSRLAGQFHGDDYADGEAGDDYVEGDDGADVLSGGNRGDDLPSGSEGDLLGGRMSKFRARYHAPKSKGRELCEFWE